MGVFMKKLLLAAVTTVGAVTVATPASAAPIIAPVPTANYITFGGRDWAWAAPCAPEAPSCGVVDMSYQSTQGWRVAQAADFATGPTVADFGTAADFKCAAAWFSTNYTHCDYGDGQIFAIFNHPSNPFPGNGAVETWVVRGAAGVPEPAAWALLIAGFGIAGAAMRRKQAYKTAIA